MNYYIFDRVPGYHQNTRLPSLPSTPTTRVSGCAAEHVIREKRELEEGEL